MAITHEFSLVASEKMFPNTAQRFPLVLVCSCGFNAFVQGDDDYTAALKRRHLSRQAEIMAGKGIVQGRL